MPGWAVWIAVAIVLWAVLAAFVTIAIGRVSGPGTLAGPRRVVPREKEAVAAQPASFRPTHVLVVDDDPGLRALLRASLDRKSTRLNSSHTVISYAVFCLK